MREKKTIRRLKNYYVVFISIEKWNIFVLRVPLHRRTTLTVPFVKPTVIKGMKKKSTVHGVWKQRITYDARTGNGKQIDLVTEAKTRQDKVNSGQMRAVMWKR